MKGEPQSQGSPHTSESSKSIRFYSDNRYIGERSFALNKLALSPERQFIEPKSVQRRRRQIEIAEVTARHLSHLGFPAIFESNLFDALTRKGVK
jgi:hypothetical protein